jgi:glycosyltransferase involved in cell wall biosynthesis
MKIAQVAPLWELVPPKAYGGTELVVHLLTEELVKRGHDVTLFAATGTITSAKLVECAPMALREMEEKIKLDKTHCTVMAYELAMMQEVFSHADQFDVIHNHVGFQLLPFAEFTSTPVVTTLHNALDPEPVRQLFYKNAHLPFIAISNYQRTLWPNLNYAGTVYHGIDLQRFNPCYEPGNKGYLAFLGRLSPEKGPHHAIRIARELNMKLVMAGKIDRVDRIFYEKEIARWVDGEQISYVGELNHTQKVSLLRNAAATLCPVQWPEPFGLVMIESMACGTPVFALRDGSTPEVIDQGRSGYVADSVEELIHAVREYRAYDRREVRKVAEARFSVQRMVDDHLKLYEGLIQRTRLHSIEGGRSAATRSLPPQPLTPTQVALMKQGYGNACRSALGAGVSATGAMRQSNGLACGIFKDSASDNQETNGFSSQVNPDMSEYYPEYFAGF